MISRMLMMCANNQSTPQCIDGFLNYVNNYYLNYWIADITITQDLTSLYVLDSTNFRVKWYDRNATTGAVTIATSYSTLSEYPDFILSSPLDVNGVVQSLYVWSRTVDNTYLFYVSTYERTPNAGSWDLNLTGKEQVDLSGAEFYGKPILSSNGSNAYSLGQSTNYQNPQPVIIIYGSPPNAAMYVQSVLNLQTIGTGNSIEISPDGKHLYMFGSTNQYGSNELRIFSRNLSTGILTFISPLSTLNRSYITASLLFSPDSLSVYIVDTSSSSPSYSTIDKYSRDDSTGALTYVSTFSTGVDIRNAVISKNGQSIYTESFNLLSHYIVTLNAITFSDSVALSQWGITNGLIPSYDSKFLYHPDITNNMSYFSTDVCTPPPPVGSGSNVYVVNEFASVTTYNRNLTSGALNQVSNIGGWTNTPNEIVLSYDGKNAYVLEQGQPGYVKVFDRDLTNGILTFASSIAAGSLSLGIEISPDDKNVYVTNNVDNNLSIFTRNLSTGALSGTTTIATGSGPVEVVISPDGKNVYVSESGYTQISIFDRDLTNGSLSGSSTLYYFQQSFGVVISSNGENIYVSNYNDNSVTIIDRDVSDGSLSIASTVSTGANTLPYGIAISPDSKNVYVTSSANAINPGLCVFTRNLSTGSLSGLTFIASSSNAVPTRVEVSSDNKNVYMTNQGNDTVSVFDRNISTGALTLASTLATGTAPQGLAVYPTPTPTPTPSPINPYCVSMAGSTGVNGTYTFVSTPSSFYSYGYWEKIGDTAYTFGYDSNEEWWVIKNSTTYIYGANVSGYTVPPSMWSYTYGMGTSPPPYTASGTC